MATYNTIDDLRQYQNRWDFSEFPQDEVTASMTLATELIESKVPPIVAGATGYDEYERALPLLKKAHAMYSLHFLVARLQYDFIEHGKSGDILNLPGGLSFGAQTPETNTVADYYQKIADNYRAQGDEYLKSAYRKATPKRVRSARPLCY